MQVLLHVPVPVTGSVPRVAGFWSLPMAVQRGPAESSYGRATCVSA